MIVGFHATKLVVRDADAAEAFYRAIGLKLAGRNTGGEGDVRQTQAWLSATGDSTSHMLILTEFLEVPAPALPAYPREVWLAFNVANVDAVLTAAEAAGGSVVRPGEDRPEHGVRAAIAADPEGHVIELVGPMRGAAGHDPLLASQRIRARQRKSGVITFICHLRVRPENAAAFEALIAPVVAMTRAHEPGVVCYEFARSADEPDTYVMIEVYRDADAHAAHMARPWVVESLPGSARLIEGRPHIRQYVSGGSRPVPRSVASD